MFITYIYLLHKAPIDKSWQYLTLKITALTVPIREDISGFISYAYLLHKFSTMKEVDHF